MPRALAAAASWAGAAACSSWLRMSCCACADWANLVCRANRSYSPWAIDVLSTSAPSSDATSTAMHSRTNGTRVRAWAGARTTRRRGRGAAAGVGAGRGAARTAVACAALMRPTWSWGAQVVRGRAQPLRRAQPHRRRSRVGRTFGVVGLLRAPGEQAQVRTVALGLHREPAGGARLGAPGQGVLDQPVLEGVVREHQDAATDRQALDGRRKRPLERAELVVDLDPDGLERALGRVAAGGPGGRRDGRPDHRRQPGQAHVPG